MQSGPSGEVADVALLGLLVCVLECSNTLGITLPSTDSSQPVSVFTNVTHTGTSAHTHLQTGGQPDIGGWMLCQI